MAKRKFKKGDTVTWTSQSHGTKATKTGKVIGLAVRGQKELFKISDRVRKAHKLSRVDLSVSTIAEDKYIVSVPDGDRKPWLYAPTVRMVDKQN